RSVAGIDRRYVWRADPDAIVALPLEIEAFMAVGDEGQVFQAGAADAQLRHCPALRDQPDARYARALRDLFSPGAGSVDQNARGHFAGRGGESPALAGRLGTQQLGIGPHRPRAAAQRSKAGIVEGSDLDVGASALVPGANPLVTQAGDERIELFSIEPGWAIFAGQAAN